MEPMRLFPETWAYIYQNHHDFLASPLGYSAFIIAVYLLAGLPWLIVDSLRLFKKDKIQKDQYFNLQELCIAFGQYLVTEVFVYLPLTFTANAIGLKVEVAELPPTVVAFVTQISVAMLVLDFTVFLMHYFLHTKFMYKHFHSVHHQYRTPFSFASQAHHPVEAILMGITIVTPVSIFCRHIITQWCTFALIMTHGTWAHSGYDWGLFKKFGGYLGFPAYHDSHHLLTTKNLGAYTTIWDRLFGTYVTPPIYAKKDNADPREQKVEGRPRHRRRIAFFTTQTSRKNVFS